MPQSLANIAVHLVFSTKHRAPLIRPEDCTELHAYMGGILRNIGCEPAQIGGVQDHVHLLFRLGRTVTVAQAVENVKTGSSKWMKPRQENFAWQSGYAAFSIGAAETSGVLAYIQNQEAHHRKVTFQEEYRRLLEEAGVKFDEQCGIDPCLGHTSWFRSANGGSRPFRQQEIRRARPQAVGLGWRIAGPLGL